ncbi:polysaccharide lyase 8 family protein [Vibrio nomapromontoriensis]|uniref:polysaccharide lyase 8 family protein n=1 Tax=Vibrio nomapromontoriensis TaxID=2910246 RepID=UPI003D146FFC
MTSFKQPILAIVIGSLLFGCGSESNSPTKEPENQPTVEVFRAKWNHYLIGDPALEYDSALQAKITTLNTQTKGWLNSQPLREDGTFADLVITPSNIDSQLRANYLRLLAMAKSYTLPQGDLFGNVTLKTTIESSLTRLNQHYYHANITEQPGNWWNWQIGTPKAINDILMLMKDDLDPDLISQYILATRHFVPDPTTINVGGNIKPSVGANLVDTSQVVLIRGILDKNDQDIDTALQSVSAVIDTVSQGDGFYLDHSFIQHTDIPYTGTYGNELIKGLGLMVGSAEAAQLPALDDLNLERIYPILMESFYPFLVNGRMMDSVNGRAISRISGQNDKLGHAIINAMLLYVASTPDSYQEQLSRVIKSQILTDLQGDFFDSIGLFYPYQMARTIVEDSAIGVIDNRREHIQFPAMDRVVHHRPDWSFSIAMHSNRVGNYECINSENTQGWYTGDGVTYLYNQQDHYNQYWPVVDAHKLPGITVLDEARNPCSGQRSEQGEGRQDAITWSGGTQLEQYGSVGFNFTNYNNLLSAKKSWFLFDQDIIALGSNITNNSSNNALTVIENRKVAHDATIYVNGEHLSEPEGFTGHLERLEIEYDTTKHPLQYIALSGNTANIKRTCRQGDWSDIGVNSGKVEGCFVSATFDSDHHNNYQYAIVPNTASGYVPAVEVLSNDATAHVVIHQTLNLIAANFWQRGKVGNIEAQTPLSMMMKQHDNGDMTVSVSDPTWSSHVIAFSLGQNTTISNDPDHRVSIDASGIISIDVDGLDGQSYTFSLKRI